MKIRKPIYRELFIIALAMIAAACSDEQYETNKVEEGLPASVTLSLSVPSALESTMTRATDEQETIVEKVAFLFYPKSRSEEMPIVVEAENNDWNVQKPSTTHYQYTNITVSGNTGLTSGEWYLYAVANYGRNGVELDDLKTKTKAQIDELCTEGNDVTDIIETSILMSGKYGTDGSLTLRAGSNTLQPIKLYRLVAKSTFTVKAKDNSNIKFTLQSCELHKYPYSSTLMERAGWNNTAPGTLQHKGNPGSIKDKIDITTFNTNTSDKSYSFFFYTQENVQHAKTYQGIFDYNMREARVGTDKDNPNFEEKYNTFKYAADDASYVVIKGVYEGPGREPGGASATVTGNVTYTIHLGDFSNAGSGGFDNFSVRRNVKYNYTVTIEGVDKIIVEAMSQGDDFQNGAEGDIVKKDESATLRLDAHYETVLLKIKQLGDDYALSVKTPYTHKIYTDINDIDAKDDISWIKFGKPASVNRFYSYGDLYKNNYGGLCDIKQLLKELKNGNGNHILTSGSYIYVAAYVDEYSYVDSHSYKVESDISKFVNVDDREMTLTRSMHISKDGHSTYTTTPIFSLKQRSIKSCFDLKNCPNPFGIETTEETAAKRFQSGDDEGEGDYINWPYNDTSKERDGYKNTCVVDNNIIGKKWSTYINQAYNGYIGGTISSTDNIMKSRYNYSIYQFLTRNRDLNGDDIIDADEIRWYIPAHEQCLEFWYGHNSLPTEVRLNTNQITYLTSTPGVNRTWWVDEGVAFGYWKPRDNSGLNTVRVIRSLKGYNQPTTPIATYNSTTRVVTINYLDDANLRTTSMSGNYAAHKTGAEADKLPRKFKIAKDYLESRYSASTIATDNSIGYSYHETNLSERGKWRVPNEKELGLMLQFTTDLKQYTGGRTKYGNNRYYYVQNNDGKFITTNDYVKSYTMLYIRLVRDYD